MAAAYGTHTPTIATLSAGPERPMTGPALGETMLDVSKLNDHSRDFAHRLFRLFPEWIRYARFDPYEDFEPEAMLVEVPRPVGDPQHGLFITTSEWEVSVGFGENFHTRFGSDGDPGEAHFFDRALAFIEGFVAERLVVATAQQDNEWLGAWTVDRTREDIDELTVEPGVTLTIRSWRGTFDRKVVTAE